MYMYCLWEKKITNRFNKIYINAITRWRTLLVWGCSPPTMSWSSTHTYIVGRNLTCVTTVERDSDRERPWTGTNWIMSLKENTPVISAIRSSNLNTTLWATSCCTVVWSPTCAPGAEWGLRRMQICRSTLDSSTLWTSLMSASTVAKVRKY